MEQSSNGLKHRQLQPTMKEQKNEENLAEEELQLNRPLNSEKTTKDSIITPNFYVFPNPLLAIPVAYGLYLVFFAWLAPNSIPSSIPFGDFVKTFGKNNHDVVAGFSIFAIIAHSIEALYAIYLSRNRYKIKPYKVFLWFLNGLLFGIFALWPLIFPKMYFKIRNWIYELFSKCKNPDTSIDVTPNS